MQDSYEVTQQGACHWAPTVVPPARDRGGWQEASTKEQEQSNSKFELENGWVFCTSLLLKGGNHNNLPAHVILAGQNKEQKTCLCSCMCGNPNWMAFSGGKVSAHYHQQSSGWLPPLEHFPCRCKRNVLELLKNYSLENVSECLAILIDNGPTFLVFLFSWTCW